jgi:hypothetical protein
MKRAITTVVLLVLAASLSACSPEVGSRKWCEKMEDTPKGDWSTNDATAYAKHCVLKNYTDED